MKNIVSGICFLSIFLFIPPALHAHPGRTASDGCHYCRTNCSSWGEVAGARHCHNGYSSYSQSFYYYSQSSYYSQPLYYTQSSYYTQAQYYAQSSYITDNVNTVTNSKSFSSQSLIENLNNSEKPTTQTVDSYRNYESESDYGWFWFLFTTISGYVIFRKITNG